MFSIIIFGAMMAVGISGQSVTSLEDILNPDNLFDGPSSISHAITTNRATIQPTVANMQYYVYYAASSYCSDQLKDLSCYYCQYFKNDVNANNGIAVLTNDTIETLAFVTVSDSRQEIVLTYRGTDGDNILNYVNDILLFDTSIDNAKVNTGFYISTMSLYNDAVTAIAAQRKLYPDYEIVIVGHSSGGAMARLTLFFLLQLSQFPGAVYELYTYGEPRVGNKQFVDFFNTQNIISARVVNMADIVPHLPPTSLLDTTLLFDYYIQPHLEFWIISETEQRFANQSFYEDPTSSDSLGPNYTVADHGNYFGLDFSNCGQSSEEVLTGLPFNTSNPVDIPPLPQLITDVVGGLLFFVTELVGDLLGGLLGLIG